MSNNNGRNYPQRKKNALDNRHLKLSAPCPSASGKWSTLGWGLYKNDMPRITVYTNDPADSGNDNGMIKAPMRAPDFFALMAWLNKLKDMTTAYRHKIELMDYIYPGGKRSQDKVVVANLWVGRDEEGVIWISPQSTDNSRPKIKFPMGPADWANWIDSQGNSLGKGEISALYTDSYVTMISRVMEQLLVSEYKEPEQKNDNRNNGGGGGGGRQQQQQQNNNSGFDEDLPF